jgi:hypothetical protein
MAADHVKYLVVWSIKSGKDDFAAFENEKSAQQFYEELLKLEGTYTAALCEILRSTDYFSSEG